MNGKPVFGIDVDGTLAEYHEFFQWFAEMYLGKPLNSQPYHGGPFARHLGMSRAKYREVKLAFRQSGLKRAMPAYAGAADLTRALRKAGAEVVICTTRPYLHLSNIEPDLREWLRRNGIQYDDIILGEHKYRELKRGYGDRVVATLDDLPDLCAQSERAGFHALLRSQPWNLHHYDNESRRVYGLGNAQHRMLAMLKERLS